MKGRDLPVQYLLVQLMGLHALKKEKNLITTQYQNTFIN